MVRKRGFMVSFMIIIGIVVLIMLFLALAMRNQISDAIRPRVSDVSGVQIYVENCVDAVSRYAFYKAGRQGGSITLKQGHFSTQFIDTNYVLGSGNSLPELDEIRAELELFIDNSLKNCTAGFRGFESQGMKIEEGEVKTSIIFGARSAIVTVSYPLRIEYQDKTFAIEKFQKDIPVSFRKTHSDTGSFIGLEERYDLLCLNRINANFFITPFEETDLFVEERLDSRADTDSYLFIFAVS